MTITKKSLSHYTIHTEIFIDAPPEKVWNILMDTPTIPSWSNNFQGFETTPKKGEMVSFHFLMNGKKNPVTKPLVEFEANKGWAWAGPVVAGTRDYHAYRLEAVGKNGTRFTQSDEIRGFAAIFLGNYIMGLMKRDYPIFNQKLKEQAEKKNG